MVSPFQMLTDCLRAPRNRRRKTSCRVAYHWLTLWRSPGPPSFCCQRIPLLSRLCLGPAAESTAADGSPALARYRCWEFDLCWVSYGGSGRPGFGTCQWSPNECLLAAMTSFVDSTRTFQCCTCVYPPCCLESVQLLNAHYQKPRNAGRAA